LKQHKRKSTIGIGAALAVGVLFTEIQDVTTTALTFLESLGVVEVMAVVQSLPQQQGVL
jgi:hypothetical protein